MKEYAKPINEMMGELPPEQQAEVHDFVEFLLSKQSERSRRIYALTKWEQWPMARQTFNLDFEDAYRYATAEKYDLTIVSFDKDFARTMRGQSEPSAIT